MTRLGVTMYCVGLTGNIASGKSTAISHFKSLGIHVISADQIAKELTLANQPALKKIHQHFGDDILTQEGELCRTKLRKIIFNNPKEKQWLENLLHPLIRKNIEQEITKCREQYCVIEIPLLTNRNDYPYLNRVLLIVADKDTLIHRVMNRDHCTKEEALAILSSQPNEFLLRNLADDVILNLSNSQEFENSIKKIHEQYLLFANKARL